jgi:hypothetical protein
MPRVGGFVFNPRRFAIQENSKHNHEEYLNEVDGNGPPEDSNLATKLTHEQMKSLLSEREALMQKGAADGEVTDQWRVYQHVIGCIERNEYLRCMIQAGAGTGKSFRRLVDKSLHHHRRSWY